MNYLAHFHLADGCDQQLVGALLGDHVKGPLQGRYPSRIEHGIWLHRRIDAITDQDSSLRQLGQRFGAEHRRYSGILLDLCFDHFLSIHWSRYHTQPLPLFAQQIYRVLRSHYSLMPEPARRQAEGFALHDVLCGYCDWGMVERALPRIAQRMQRGGKGLMEASTQLPKLRKEMEKTFLEFYPRLADQVQREALLRAAAIAE